MWKRYHLFGIVLLVVFITVTLLNVRSFRRTFTGTTALRLIRNQTRNSFQEVVRIPCIGNRPGMSEDLFCMNKRDYLREYRNPCWRDKNSKLRCLPYFHLIGSDKCGSTDLFNRITHHPEVETCSCEIGKESWYWSWTRYGVEHRLPVKRKKSFSSYIAMFDKPAGIIEKHVVNGYHPKVVGDGTPMDFWDFRGWTMIPQNMGLSEPIVTTPHLMRHVYGDMKFLLIFRNPIDRLYSDYFFLRYGNSSESFHTDVIASVNMMSDCLRHMSVRTCFFSDELYKKLPTRIHVGCYSVFLKEWLAVFPRESFHFIRTEDYKTNIIKAMEGVFRFLNLGPLNTQDMSNITTLQRKHETKSKKHAGSMLAETRKLLRDFYEPYNRELSSILKDRRFLW